VQHRRHHPVVTFRQRGKSFAVAAFPQLTRPLGRRLFGTGDGGRGEPVDPAAVRRLLVVRLDEIGDAVMNVPLLRALRSRFPEAHVTAVVRPAAAALLAPCPYVDALHVLDTPAHGISRVLGRYRRALAFARAHFPSEPFDLAVVPRWEVDKYFATCLAYWSGARWRVGYSEHVSREKEIKNHGWDRLLTHPLPGGHGEHEVRRALGVAAFLGARVDDDALELWTTPGDEAAADRLLDAAGVVPGTPLVALAPGAGLPRRQWPAACLAEVGRRLAEHDGLRPLVLGSPDDRPLGAVIAARVGPAAVDLTGRASLRETVSLLRRCRLFVGNDSGPMHLAAAAGTPVVEVSCHPHGGDPEHPNAPERFGPWGTTGAVVRPEAPRPPCTDGCASAEPHCILEVSVDAVYGATQSLLAPVPLGSVPAGYPARSAP
jgi:heptosyltransferase-2